jgi:superfamily II DNA/RNA helicase
VTTFAELGVAPELVEELATGGVVEPFPIQEMTVRDALAGRDVCGKAKTGSGKTLAFGIPLLRRTKVNDRGRPGALILVPTRELAVQVTDVLKPLAERAELRLRSFYGGAPMEPQIKALRQGVDVVVATPGRLIDLGERGELSVEEVEIVVLDEADRMADMGFLPQVEWFLRRITRDHQTMLFSATLDRDVDHLIKQYLRDPVRHEVASDTVTVEEMTHRFIAVHQLDKAKVVAAISAANYRTLVFTKTKRGADRLSQALRKEGVKSGAIHGDLRQSQRERALKDFTDGKLPVLVATDVAARGLHIDAIDVVVHYDPAEDHKTYLHRSGRTARAGASGVAVTLVLWNQHLDAEKLQKRLGIRQPIVEMFSNDPRLADLGGFEPE